MKDDVYVNCEESEISNFAEVENNIANEETNKNRNNIALDIVEKLSMVKVTYGSASWCLKIIKNVSFQFRNNLSPIFFFSFSNLKKA